MEKMDVQSPNFGGPNPEGLTNGLPGGGMTNGPYLNGPSQPSFATILSGVLENQKPPGWQLDLMMEKLQQKSNQLKPLTETAKNIRTALTERRYFMDQTDRVYLQKNLDSLQQSIKVNSLQSMVERLEMVSRQLGLKFTSGGNGEWFISSDMFYLELLIDPSGTVQEVKIQHDGKTEQQNVPEMVDCLRRNDFGDFTAHLEGLVAIYQLNADKKIKSKAFIALQALEADLLSMASTYAHVNDGEAVVMKSLLGLLQPRKGGHPVKLVYFVSPYEFLDTDTKMTLNTDAHTIIEKKLGSVANICIQASTSRKLQMSTTVSLMRTPDCKTTPRYGTLNATNSTALPACFTINLGKPIPICKELLMAIQTITGIQCFDFSDPQPILGLITRHVSNGTLDCSNNRGLFVALPDTPDTLQVHCYFMTETASLEGITVSSINFTLASQLPPVIALLRQQVIFNTLVGSCVRVGCKPEMDCTVFEVNALSYQNISVSFQHPLEDSLVTLEFDLRDVSHPSCRLHVVKPMVDIIPTLEEHACKVVQRSLSIPVTVRAVIRRWQTMKSKYEPSPEYSVPVGGSYGSESFNASNSEMSCGTESEKHQGQQQQHNPQHSMVPGMVMGLNGGPNPSALSNFGNTNSASISALSQHHGNSTPGMHYGSTHSGRHPSGSSNSSYTISPVSNSNSNTGLSNSNFQSPATTPTPATSSADLMSSFMNPMFFTNQMNMGSNMQGNFPNMGGMTLQNFLEAKQNITGMLDQGGQRGRRRKRKGTSSDSNMNTGTSPSGGMTIQGNPSVTRPSPSPSPKSPRTFGNSKSPKRRPSEGSDISDTSQGENTRAPTPQTPLTPRGDSNAALSLLMNEIGMDVPDPRWNIDITPVGGPLGSSNQGSNSSSGMDNFIASKLLSNLGSSITSTSNMGSSVGSEFSIENVDLDMEIEPSDGLSSGFMGSKFSMPMSKKPGAKKSRDFPKRSISLDSHSSGNLDDIGANLQSLINSATNSGAGGMDAATSVSSLVTPSLSITPVTTNSSMGQTTVNSLLAAIRPGIEIIPLPNPVQIPNSITVTPIQPKPLQSMADGSKKGTTSLIGKDKTKGDETTVSTIDGNGTTIKKKLSSSSLPGDSSSKKERKRKASSVVPPLLDEDGMIVQDYNPIKQPKLSGPFSSSNASLFSSLGEKKNSGGPGSSISVSLKGGPSPSFGMGMKKPGSPGLARAPTPNKSQSPTPKIGGKPSVSTLKSVSGSPKYSEMSVQSSMKSKNNKERKNSSGFQGNPKIAKNLSLVGGPPGLPNLVPNLKSLSDGSNLPLSLATLNPSLLGLSNTNAGNLKTAEASMAEALMKANLLSKSVMDSNKLQQQNQLSSQGIPNNATSNPGQRTPGGNNNSANVAAANNNNNNNSIAAAAAAAGGFGAKKGLLAVIDKLKSQQHTPEEIAKKDAGKMDYLKVSSSITSDVMQFKKNQNAGANPGNIGSAGPGGNNGGNNQGGNGGSGFSGNNQEYMVKPGGQGLKMKLGITSKSSNSLKDKTKAGMKLLSNAKKGFSGPKSQQGSISSSQSSSSSSTSKSTPSGTGFSTSSTPNKKSSSSSSSGSKSAEKDQNSGDKSIKSQKSSSSSTSANVTSSSGSKGRPEEDKDLTRKLFMPGSGVFDAPKFDITKYQIPKKSSSGAPSGGSGTGQNQGGNNENSPKNSKASSPQSQSSKSSDRDVITPTKDVEKLSSSLSSSKALFTSSSSEGKELQFKDKDVVSLMQTATNSELPAGSSSSSSVLLSTSIMESKSSYSSSGNPGTPSEPTKIKLSSSSISEMPFLQEMNKLFANSPMSVSMGSPMNLSGPTSMTSNKYPRESSSGSSEADSSTDNNSKTFGDSKSLGSTRDADRNSSSGHGAKDFASPESPDPMNNIQDDAIYKNTLTIPTTPLQTSQPIIIDDQPITATLDTSLDDDDQLVMDVQDKNSKGSSSGNTPEKSTKTSSTSLNPPDDSGPKNSKENFFMPPPPVPDSSSTPSSSTSSGGNSQTSVNSPIMSTASVPSPTPVASVKSPAPAATVPIVSVHIVHSPQPNSPALLRSPLVVQSPHSSHASPYAIDDDLMDEALIGTGK